MERRGFRVTQESSCRCAGRRDIARLDADQRGKGWELVFHKGQSEVVKPLAVMIAAGAAHSSVVTQDGTVMTWRSMDPTLTPTAVGDALAGKTVVKISAGGIQSGMCEQLMWMLIWGCVSLPTMAHVCSHQSHNVCMSLPSPLQPHTPTPVALSS